MGLGVKWTPPTNVCAPIDFGVVSNLTLNYNHMTEIFHQDREVIQFLKSKKPNYSERKINLILCLEKML